MESRSRLGLSWAVTTGHVAEVKRFGTRAALAASAALAVVSIACASAGRPARVASASVATTDRRVVRSAELAVSVDSIAGVVAAVERLVREAGGFVERSTTNKGSDERLQCRVPGGQLEPIMDRIAALGDEQRRLVSAADVTEQYADLETRLRNNMALRDRLQQLLARATDVEDVLAIEKELNRIQSEIETMQARFDRLKAEIEFAALSVTLERKRILGPLGHVGRGLWWLISKLFIIR